MEVDERASKFGSLLNKKLSFVLDLGNLFENEFDVGNARGENVEVVDGIVVGGDGRVELVESLKRLFVDSVEKIFRSLTKTGKNSRESFKVVEEAEMFSDFEEAFESSASGLFVVGGSRKGAKDPVGDEGGAIERDTDVRRAVFGRVFRFVPAVQEFAGFDHAKDGELHDGELTSKFELVDVVERVVGGEDVFANDGLGGVGELFEDHGAKALGAGERSHGHELASSDGVRFDFAGVGENGSGGVEDGGEGKRRGHGG